MAQQISPAQQTKAPPARPAWRRYLVAAVPWVGLLSLGALVSSVGILSGQFILDPHAVLWVNQYLPDGLQLPIKVWDAPRPLSIIQAEIQSAGWQWGEAIALSKTDQLVPIVAVRPNCTQLCDRIVQVRIYRQMPPIGRTRSTQLHYRMIAQLVTDALPEWALLDSLSRRQIKNLGLGSSLPVSQLVSLEAPKGSDRGQWFLVQGERQTGDHNVRYGQVIYYQAQPALLESLLVWASPTGEIPLWQQVTGSTTPELVVNQSLGLDPQFQAYQVQDRVGRSPQLQPLSLDTSALKDPNYLAALDLAKAGLWSTALDRLQAVQAQGKWSTSAQEQLDWVSYHARITQAQADQPWVNAEQQMLAKLLDGRWEKALDVARSKFTETDALAALIENDPSSRLWTRVNAQLALSPDNVSVQAWTALLMAQRQSPQAARRWLKARGLHDRPALNQILMDIRSDLATQPTRAKAMQPSLVSTPTLNMAETATRSVP